MWLKTTTKKKLNISDELAVLAYNLRMGQLLRWAREKNASLTLSENADTKDEEVSLRRHMYETKCVLVRLMCAQNSQ